MRAREVVKHVVVKRARIEPARKPARTRARGRGHIDSKYTAVWEHIYGKYLTHITCTPASSWSCSACCASSISIYTVVFFLYSKVKYISI